jgi:N-acetyl sugar amidotransferase
MDTSDKDISFNTNGVCNHCIRYESELPKRTFLGENNRKKLELLLDRIGKSGRNKSYDCIIGVSGGVDSTYVAYLCKKLGLRPLAVHFDNGWNSELAVSNISRVLDNLQIDLVTYVVDWDEFKYLQRSFLRASTPDGEIPTDHAITALLFQIASEKGIKFIVTGMNFATESMSVSSWSYGHSDWKYIRSVNSQFENRKLNSYPHFTLFNLFWWTFIKRIEFVSILNYIDFNKKEAIDLLQNELGWVYYGGKHYESIYTRFYQAYILPVKFGIDKRRAHLSDLISSGQISRDEALNQIEKSCYPPLLLDEDLAYVKKKLLLSDQEWSDIMSSEIKSFKDFPNNFNFISQIKRLLNYFRSNNWYSK